MYGVGFLFYTLEAHIFIYIIRCLIQTSAHSYCVSVHLSTFFYRT